MAIFVQLLPEGLLCFEGILLIPPVDVIDPLNSALVAGAHLHLPLLRPPLPLLLPLVELNQLLLQLPRFLPLLLALLLLFLVVAAVDLLEMLLIELRIFGLLLFDLFAVGLVFGEGGLDFTLDFSAGGLVLLLLPPE